MEREKERLKGDKREELWKRDELEKLRKTEWERERERERERENRMWEKRDEKREK